MADSPFGAYRGGYQAMPQGWLQAAMQPGENYAQAIQSFAGNVAGGIGKMQANKAQKEAISSSLPSQYSMYQQTAQTIGQPIDPTLAERYAQMGQMSLPQMEAFSKDLGAAQQQSLAIANLQRQQAAFQAQQQAMQRAEQAQALAARRASIMGFLGGAPAAQPSMPQGGGPLPTMNPLLPNVGGF